MLSTYNFFATLEVEDDGSSREEIQWYITPGHDLVLKIGNRVLVISLSNYRPESITIAEELPTHNFDAPLEDDGSSREEIQWYITPGHDFVLKIGNRVLVISFSNYRPESITIAEELPNLSAAAAYTASGRHTIIDIIDETDNQGGNTRMPVNSIAETNFGTKISNDIILGITGQAAIALVSSSSSDSLFLHIFVAATGIGFLGSFLANYFLKKPKVSLMLSKIGAIGTASAVITVLGMYLPKDAKWNLNIVATVGGGLTTAIMVVIS